jgi:hypothetical protein
MQFKCERCCETVQIEDDTQSLNCATCGADLVVQRSRGTITVKVKVKEPKQDSECLSKLGEQLEAELVQLKTELKGSRRRTAVMTVVGGFCAVIFGAFAILAFLDKDANIGFTTMLCAGGCSWFVLFVHRDGATFAATTAVRVADVNHRITENKRIALAAKREIHRVVIDLFLREIIHYPSWIHRSRSYVPSCVTEAVEVDTDSDCLTIDGSNYLFTVVREPWNAGRSQIALRLVVDDSLVLSAGADLIEDQMKTHAVDHYLDTLQVGPWIEELFGLWADADAGHHAKVERNLRRAHAEE